MNNDFAQGGIGMTKEKSVDYQDERQETLIQKTLILALDLLYSISNGYHKTKNYVYYTIAF